MPMNDGSDGNYGQVDVAVVGGGPSGRWLATLLVRRGLRVALIDPQIDRRWPNTYGVWVDEIEEFTDTVSFSRVWQNVVVVAESRHVLERAYGRIANEVLRRRLDVELDARDTLKLEASATEVVCDGRIVRLGLEDGCCVEARLVVDASGGAAGLVETPETETVPVQRAYGIEARFCGDPLWGAGMVLMDYRTGEGGVLGGAPSFLYGMHLGGDRYFVEETVLVTSRSVPFASLRRRLASRLAARDAQPAGEIETEEHCHIPMGTPLPGGEGPVLGFGASAGLVHPATGYQMARMLRAGPSVSDAIADKLHHGASPVSVARCGRQALWPTSLRRARKLHLLGRDLLMGFDHRQLQRFFETFFSLSERQWRAYLRGDTRHDVVARVMWRLFRRATAGLRLSLVRRALADRQRLVDAWRTAPNASTTVLGRR